MGRVVLFGLMLATCALCGSIVHNFGGGTWPVIVAAGGPFIGWSIGITYAAAELAAERSNAHRGQPRH